MIDYVGAMVLTHCTGAAKVLELGSYNENGSVRPLFAVREFLGVDVRDGPGVDMVIDPSFHYPMWAHRWDVIVCTETLEHDLRPWRTVRHVSKWLKQGGVFICTVRGFNQRGSFPYHGHPGDYWRFSVEGVRALLEDYQFNILDCREDPHDFGAFITARKPGHHFGAPA